MNTSTIWTYVKSSVLAGLVAVAAVAPAHRAVAQSPSTREVATIPFDFRSGSQLMPAGTYEISQLSDTILLLRGANQPRVQVMSAFHAASAQPQKSGKLVFHRYGNSYFLYQVWSQGRDTGFQFPKGHAEKEMLRAKAEIAPPTTMELALNQAPR